MGKKVERVISTILVKVRKLPNAPFPYFPATPRSKIMVCLLWTPMWVKAENAFREINIFSERFPCDQNSGLNFLAFSVANGTGFPRTSGDRATKRSKTNFFLPGILVPFEFASESLSWVVRIFEIQQFSGFPVSLCTILRLNTVFARAILLTQFSVRTSIKQRWSPYSDHFICSMSALSVLFFFIIEQSIDGSPLLLLRYVRKGNDTNRVRTHLESPWKPLNLKIKIQGLESLWKVHWVLEKPWNLLFDCFHLVEELEKT